MIQQQQTPPEEETKPLSIEDQLRRRTNALIHERDFWQGVAETKGEKLSTMLDEHRYRLSIHCDVKTCHAVVSVSSSQPPADGLLATALVMTAAIMRWRIGPETVAAMRALTKDGALLVTGKSDRCPDHHEPTEAKE